MKTAKPALIFALVVGLLFAEHSTADASGIWEPTAGKVEFTFVDNESTGIYLFALFDDIQAYGDGLDLIFNKKTPKP